MICCITWFLCWFFHGTSHLSEPWGISWQRLVHQFCGWKAGKLKTIIQQQRGFLPWPCLEQLPGFKRQQCSCYSFPQTFWWGLCVLLQCICAAQKGLHRSLAFLPEVTHYLLSLMLELGQNVFLLLPLKKYRWQRRSFESMEINGKFPLLSQGLGFHLMHYILKWERLRVITWVMEAVLVWTSAEAKTFSETNESSWESEKDWGRKRLLRVIALCQGNIGHYEGDTRKAVLGLSKR